MFRVHNETIPKSLQTKFQYIEHNMKLQKVNINLLFQKEIHKLPVLLYIVSGIHSTIIQLRP